MKDKQPDILSLLIRHELALKQLYGVFADTFHKQVRFWEILAGEEQQHADWLETLRADSTSADLITDRIPFKPQAIQSSIEYVERQTKKALQSGFSLIQALSISKDLENALIEKIFSKLGQSPSREVRRIIEALIGETEKHRNMLLKMMEKEMSYRT